MDISDLAQIGTRIAELGLKLKTKRAEQADIQKDIVELEKELTPLVAQHSKIIAEFIGVPAAPTPTPHSIIEQAPPTDALDSIKKRVLAFLQDAEPNTSASEVAAALRLDPVQVRQAMMSLVRRS